MDQPVSTETDGSAWEAWVLRLPDLAGDGLDGGEMAQPRARVARAGVLTVSASGLALLAHGATAGCVEVAGVLITVGAVSAAAWPLVGKRRSLATVLGWLVAAQLAGHLVLATFCGAHEPPVGLAMMAAHGGAVVVTALLLQRADAALWSAPVMPERWARWLRGVLCLVCAPAVPGAPAVLASAPRGGAPLLLKPHCPPPARRGPPQPVATLTA